MNNEIYIDSQNTVVGENTDVFGLQAAYLKEVNNLSNKKHLLKLNHEHYRKLLSMWCITNNSKNDDEHLNEQLFSLFIDNNEKNNKYPPTTSTLLNRFHNDLYILLSRYYALQGHGFQAACPEDVFQVLKTSKLNAEYELFASPLNCFYGPSSYCSLFPEIDCKFGSLGSFWNFVPSLKSKIP